MPTKRHANAKPKRCADSTVIQITTTKNLVAILDRVVLTGFFGNSRAAAAERLLAEAIRQLLKEGTIQKTEESVYGRMNMSDWNFLNANRISVGMFRSTASDGFNGLFRFRLLDRPIKIIASDGQGWQHVSVSQDGSHKPPNWDVMCAVKDLFWNDEDVVVQFHPAKSNYVNNHPGCLHLWRCTDGRSFPTPPEILVGIKGLGTVTRKTAPLAAAMFALANLTSAPAAPRGPETS